MAIMHQSEREKRGNCHWCSPRSPVSYRSQALLLENSLFVPVFIFSTAIHVKGEIRAVDLPFLKIFNYSLLSKFWWWICEWSELGTKMKNQSTLTCMLLIGILCIHCGAAPQRFGSLVAENSREEEPANGSTTAAERDPASIAQMVQRSIDNSTRRRELAYLSCGTGNPIDDCWRCDPNWESHRKRLADCAIGFGRNAQGGKKGKYYVVTDNSDDDALNPRLGTLRYAVIQTEPLWIIFQRDMVIQLKEELMMNYFKTIDGRGVNVHIANGPCITIHGVRHIIIHGIHIHDCVPAGNALVRDSPTHYEWRPICDGDGISISAASNIWVDHVSMARCADGLIDATRGSTAITISNSYFTQHNEVMLLGHHDNYTGDVRMQVTVAFNHFGEGLVQRMPRCRHGYFHVVNNDYSEWGMYAIGGSANPTINSQGNRFMASANPSAKEVTKRINQNSDEWKSWNWRSDGDMMLNGAYFNPSGTADSWAYIKASSLEARPSTNVGPITRDAGVLNCSSGARC